MKPPPDMEITRLLLDWSGGNSAALSALYPLVYDELRSIAQRKLNRERPDHTLQRTALVHEAFLRLVDQKNVNWHSRAQFFGLAAQMMRRILVDYARKRNASKRGSHAMIDIEAVLAGDDTDNMEGSAAPAPVQEIDVDFEAVDAALERLEKLDQRQGKIVELRFFGGLSLDEAAEIMGVSVSTVKREWVFARAWLQRELSD